MKVGILNNLYRHLFPIPKQLFSKDYFAVYNNTLWENLPLLPGQKILRTLYTYVLLWIHSTNAICISIPTLDQNLLFFVQERSEKRSVQTDI